MGTLATAGVASFSGCSQKAGPLEKAAQYLWSQQASDGGFHSSTYGLLRSGQSLTPFVLRALLIVPDQPSDAVDRAVTFIKANTNADGVLGMMDETAADYPNYATALAVSAMVKAKRTGYDRIIETMIEQLRLQHYRGTRMEKPKTRRLAGGEWAARPHSPPEAGHVDLSMTRYVLEALTDAGVPASDDVFKRAMVFFPLAESRWWILFFSL